MAYKDQLNKRLKNDENRGYCEYVCPFLCEGYPGYCNLYMEDLEKEDRYTYRSCNLCNTDSSPNSNTKLIKQNKEIISLLKLIYREISSH